MKSIFAIALFVLMATFSQAQNVGINSTGDAPDASAMLDVSSSSKGLLIPRVALTSPNDITTIGGPVESLLIYNTATATDVTPGYYYWSSGSWTRIGSGTIPIANGGTGATDAAGARTNLGLGTAATANTGTSSGNIPVLDGSGKIPDELLGINGLSYKGNYSLSTNPTVTVEASGNYYIISVAGKETGSGLDFLANDWMISNGTIWQKITNSAAVVSVAGKTGSVTLDGADITSGTIAIANGGTASTTAAGARTSLGATTLGGNIFTLNNPSAITFPQFNANNTVSALTAANFRTAIGAGSGSGTVTSVSGTSPISVATGTTTPVISLSTVPVANGGTGTTTGSITGTGALTFAAGGTNQPVNITPSGTGNTMLGGNVGIGGTASSGYKLYITDATTTSGHMGMYLNKSNSTASADGYGIQSNVILSGASSTGYAISGIAQGTGSRNYGITGTSSGSATNNYGVYGQALTGTTGNYGVYGLASGASGTNYGGYFTNNSTTTTHKYGSWNEATGASSGDNVGILGKALNSTGKNYGVYGTASGSAGTYTYGGYFENVATTNNNKFGAYGVASGVSNSDNWGIYGLASGSTHQNTGCVGIANVATTGTNIGASFYAGGGAANYAIVTNGGNVGFGTLTPGYPLHVTAQLAGYVAYIQNTNGTATSHGLIIQAGSTTTSGADLVVFTRPGGTTIGSITQNTTTTVAYNTTSDRRLKNNIVNTHFGIRDLMKIQVRDYTYKADAANTPTTGFIAQELYEIFPNAVSKPAKAEEMWSVDYGKVTPLLAKAIQDQQATIVALQKANEAQQKQIDELKKIVELMMKK